MVNLRYVENPFTDDYLFSFECFRDEKKFYDCIDHKTINCDDVFENLGSSFYTYLLTGDNHEWIGYVLFYNMDLINGYTKTIEIELKKLLTNLKMIMNNEEVIVNIDSLLKDLNNHKFSDTVYLADLEQSVESLKNNCISKNEDTLNCFSEYYSNIFTYLYNFNEYYYLNIVIGLPLDTKNDEIESKYYGFIGEVYHNVEELVKNRFHNVPIILKNANSILYLMNNEQQKIKLLYKEDIAKN